MSVTQQLHDKHVQVDDFRSELAQVQDALATADSYLAKTDESLIGAQKVAEETRRLAPAIGIAVALGAAVVVTVFLMRRRRAHRED